VGLVAEMRAGLDQFLFPVMPPGSWNRAEMPAAAPVCQCFPCGFAATPRLTGWPSALATKPPLAVKNRGIQPFFAVRKFRSDQLDEENAPRGEKTA